MARSPRAPLPSGATPPLSRWISRPPPARRNTIDLEMDLPTHDSGPAPPPSARGSHAGAEPPPPSFRASGPPSFRAPAPLSRPPAALVDGPRRPSVEADEFDLGAPGDRAPLSGRPRQ